MRNYIIRRLLLMIPTLFLVSIIIFFTIRMVPGDVVDLLASQIMTMTGQAEEALRQELGLDVPTHIQYVRWIKNIILHGDLGNSLWTRRPVLETILPRIPVSFELGSLSIIFSLFIAIPIGIISAVRRDSAADYAGRSLSIAFITFPSFWVGTLAMVFPAIWWYWSPPIEYVSFFMDPINNLKMFLLPSVILGMLMSGVTMRMMRTMMLEVLGQDYIRTAWAKGLREKVIIIRHALKNALIPVVATVGSQLPILIGGSVIMENIFVLPGIGRLLVQTINNRDYTVLSGINLIMSVVIIILNLLVDISYAALDPRIQYK